MPRARSPVCISCFKLLSGTYKSTPCCFIACKARPLKKPASPVTFSGRAPHCRFHFLHHRPQRTIVGGVLPHPPGHEPMIVPNREFPPVAQLPPSSRTHQRT